MRLSFWRAKVDHSKEQSPAGGEDVQQRLDAVRERFHARMRDDYAFLAECRPDCRTPDAIRVVHKLAGSAGMLGYRELSEAAGELDDALAVAQGDIPALLQKLLTALENAIGDSGRN